MTALEQALQDYLRLRHQLGYELADAVRQLPSFVAYLDSIGATTVTVRAAVDWAQSPSSRPRTSLDGRPTTLAPRRMTAARGFARYLAGIDATTEIPPLGLIPYRQRWKPPFVYSPADVDTLMQLAQTTLTTPLRAATYRTLIGLLASCGLRIGEAIRLERSDVGWDEGTLLIRESKFGKSRLVPLHPSSIEALAAYAELRDRLQPRPKEATFFVSRTRRRLCYQVVCGTFRQLCQTGGIGAGAARPPRLHDLRHTFAVRVLMQWYQDGLDVQAKIPSLSTYLGHREPSYTYWYLSAAPELLALAAQRLDPVEAGMKR
jgi:integrase